MRARIVLENGDIFEVENADISVTHDPLFANKIEISGYTKSDIAITKRVLSSFYGVQAWRNLDKPPIKKVIFNEPATIVLWGDSTKTVVKCQKGDRYSKELGLAMCIAKKYLGNKSNFNNEFKKWISKEEEPLPTIEEELLPSIEEMRAYIKKYCKRHLCIECVINNLPQHKLCRCFDESNTSDEEVIMNYKAIKESEEN